MPAQRADARRNRAAILSAAWVLFEQGGETSMAAVARRAGVGMATLYRNFPGRRELLEAVYADEVAAVCDAAREAADGAASPGAALRAWLVRFAAFITTKHGVSAEILGQVDGEAFLGAGRAAILDAGRPLLADAQRAGEVRSGLSLEQVLELVLAVASIRGPVDYVEPILQTALDGLLGPTADRPDERR